MHFQGGICQNCFYLLSEKASILKGKNLLLLPSEKGFTLNGKNLLPLGKNSFLLG